MANMETATFETELSLFKYDNLEQLPASYRELTEAERTPRIEAALDELGDDVVILGHNVPAPRDRRTRRLHRRLVCAEQARCRG